MLDVFNVSVCVCRLYNRVSFTDFNVNEFIQLLNQQIYNCKIQPQLVNRLLQNIVDLFLIIFVWLQLVRITSVVAWGCVVGDMQPFITAEYWTPQALEMIYVASRGRFELLTLWSPRRPPVCSWQGGNLSMQNIIKICSFEGSKYKTQPLNVSPKKQRNRSLHSVIA